MTAICAGGGPSSPKPGLPSTVLYLSNLASFASIPARLRFLIPIIASIGTYSADLTAICATDPPGFPTFTDADVVALAVADAGTAGHDARQKVADMLATLAWYAGCECNSGAQPAQPTPPAPPSDYLIPGDSSLEFCVPMFAADCKVLNLWNGTTNITPPTNWDQIGFNDSSWVSAVADASGVPYNGLGLGQGFGALGLTDASTINCVGDPVADAFHPASTSQKLLIRWYANMPSFDVNKVSMKLGSGSTGTGAGWQTGTTTVNGGTGFSTFNTVAWEGGIKSLKYGQNLIASYVDSGANNTSDLWGTRCWLAMTLSQPQQSAPFQNNLNCCPTDPQVTQALQAILQVVNLIQKQVSPFSYVIGSTHSGLSGNGQFAVDSILGLSVGITTVPARLGTEAGDPNQLFNAGWINVGTADGWGPRHFITSNPFILRPVSGDVTLVGYSIPADVTIEITELVHEP